MKSRVKENKELLDVYEELVGQVGPGTSLEKINSVTLSIVGTALLDISQSLAVIADAMSKEESDDSNSVI